MIAFLIALCIGSALAGAAYWSYEIVVDVNHLQKDVCLLDGRVAENSILINSMMSNVTVPSVQQPNDC